MELDRAACYRALQTRDARFDGRFFIGVRTTGIYCRPICPARLPKLENVAFYPSAAAAHEAGFRPCLRCRPECSPQLGAWRGTSRTVSRALALIGDGALDGPEASVDALALRLGIGERQLRRLFARHLGASPIAVAQTRRILLAKQLVHETRMRLVDVAAAAGFGSLRRFNDTFLRLYGRSPSSLRREASGSGSRSRDGSAIALTLGYAPPYDWPALLESFAAGAIPGVEAVVGDRYLRAIELGGARGVLDVAPLAGKNALSVRIRFPDLRALPAIIARVRNLFDLGSDAAAIGSHLSEDPWLAPLVASRPGLRVPGAWDAFELAVREIAADGVGELVSRAGESLAEAEGEISRVFPRPERIASADLVRLGLPRERANALRALARAVAADPRALEPEGDLEQKLARLCALPGLDARTASVVAMRALREPDALPTRDAALRVRAERWRPWRAYAAQYLAARSSGAREEVA